MAGHPPVHHLPAGPGGIRSLDETEWWTQFLELEPDDPMAFVGHQMVSMAVRAAAIFQGRAP